MKKFLYVLMTGLMLSSAAYAKHNCGCADCNCKAEYKMKKTGGFQDMAAAPVSLAVAQGQDDDSYVTVLGYITKRIGGDKYNFTDGAGNVTVEIDDKVWRGQTVSPKDKIVIYGQIDKDSDGMTIDVKSLMLAQ